MGYLGNFIVYTLAMVGVIVVALLVFKGSVSGGNLGKKSKYLKVMDSMSLGPRKTLYIVSTGTEKFLIAGDAERTTLISKLDKVADIPTEKPVKTEEVCSTNSFRKTMENLSKPSYMDKSNIGINSSMLHKKPVITSMLEKINEEING